MSAINVVKRRSDAFVIADSIAYDKNGVLTLFESKLTTLEHLHAVIGCRGTMLARRVIVPEISVAFTSFDDLIAGVESWLRDFWRDFVWTYPVADDTSNELTIAGWSRARGAPAVFTILTKDIPQNRYHKTGFQLYELEQLIVTQPDVFQEDYDAAVKAGGYNPQTTVRDVDPATHGALLLELQRQREHLIPSGEFRYMVGGVCEMATITADGIAMQTIGEYPDAIGEPIKPEPVDWRAWWLERGGGKQDAANVIALSPLRRKMLERKQRKAERRAG